MHDETEPLAPQHLSFQLEVGENNQTNNDNIL
jgi:hypothetical protein